MPEKRTLGRFSGAVRAWGARREAEGAAQRRRWLDEVPVAIVGGGLAAIYAGRVIEITWTWPNAGTPHVVGTLLDPRFALAFGLAAGALACLSAKRVRAPVLVTGALVAGGLALGAFLLARTAEPAVPPDPPVPVAASDAGRPPRGLTVGRPPQRRVVPDDEVVAAVGEYFAAVDRRKAAERAWDVAESEARGRCATLALLVVLALFALPGLLVPLARRLGATAAVMGAFSGAVFALVGWFFIACANVRASELPRAQVGLAAASGLVWFAVLRWASRAEAGPPPQRPAKPPANSR